MNLPTADLPLTHSRRNGLLPLAVMLLSGWTATTQAGYYVQAIAEARVDPPVVKFDSGQIAGPIATAGPFDLTQDDTEARAFAQAEYGHLSGTSFATNPSLYIRAVQAGGTASFLDTLTVTSGVLAPGTTVTVLAHVTLEDDLFFQSLVTLTGGHSLSGLGLQDQGDAIDVHPHSRSQTTTLTFPVAVDFPFMISGTLGFSSSARTYDRPNTGEVIMADARFTFEIQSSDPNATLFSESGASYAPNGPVTPAPEPGSLVLFCLGALGLVVLGGRGPGIPMAV